jgi:hypothetical protein
VPPDRQPSSGSALTDNSARLTNGHNALDRLLKRFLPFIYFYIDIDYRLALHDPAQRSGELRKSFAQIAQLRHLAMFGRPLLSGYRNNESRLRELAQLKLVSGRPAPARYNARNRDQVFAALSFRLALDVCAANARAMPVVDHAVGSYMRVIDGLDADAGVISSLAPSEPVLAQAAVELLNAAPTNRLTHEFVQRGFVERGLKGELFARLLLLLAHDVLYQQALVAAWPLPPSPPAAAMPLTPASFSALNFLTSLYAADFGGYVSVIEDGVLSARLNFTHFAVTEELLTPAVQPALLRDLLK